jgi:hypothetical protein
LEKHGDGEGLNRGNCACGRCDWNTLTPAAKVDGVKQGRFGEGFTMLLCTAGGGSGQRHRSSVVLQLETEKLEVLPT